jgi:cation diffusion facilitator CzcD-associated flavoprotein CzcO
MRTGKTDFTDVAVIGAGPYGLAAAAHLLHAGLSTRCFGRPMGAWRYNMPKGMFLKSAFLATSISSPVAGSTLGDYCNTHNITEIDDFHPIPIDVFVKYGLWFQERHVKQVEEVMVQHVAASQDGFQLTLANGETFAAANVIAASGHVPFSYTPLELRNSPRDAAGAPLITHTGDHADFDRFAGKSVAVLGAGQSALESAVLLREAGARVHLIVRGANLIWADPPKTNDNFLYNIVKPKTEFGPGWSHVLFTRAPELISFMPPATRLFLAHTTYGPSGGWWLRKRFDKAIEVTLETTVTEARQAGGKLGLTLSRKDGKTSSLEVDHLLIATGYKVDVDAMSYLDSSLRTRVRRVTGSGAPALSRDFESSVPGLYFIGITGAATFGPLLRFVHGTDFAARTVCRALQNQRMATLKRAS